MKTLSDLEADVAAEGTVIASNNTLLTGLSAQIAALKNDQTDPTTAARIDALAQAVESQTASLSAAVVANTPAAAPAPAPASADAGSSSSGSSSDSSSQQPQQ